MHPIAEVIWHKLKTQEVCVTVTEARENTPALLKMIQKLKREENSTCFLPSLPFHLLPVSPTGPDQQEVNCIGIWERQPARKEACGIRHPEVRLSVVHQQSCRHHRQSSGPSGRTEAVHRADDTDH